MPTIQGFNEFSLANGKSLAHLGLNERALTRAAALEAVRLMRAAGVALLGGDVYVDDGKAIKPAYANWHSDQRLEESGTEFMARSWRESEEYIGRYPEPRGGEALFVLVPRTRLIR
jgi:hypothetical protein